MTDTVIILIAYFGWVLACVGFFGRIERRLTRLETDLKWVIKRLDKCLPSLDKSMQ